MKESTRYITKVKHKDNRVEIEFREEKSVVDTEGTKQLIINEYMMKCGDKPRPEFEASLKALAPHVCDICELPSEQVSKIKVSGVSFSYGGDDNVMGASIIATKSLTKASAPLNIVTPHKSEYPYSESGDESVCLTVGCAIALTNVLEEAEAYISGQREQGDLFTDTLMENIEKLRPKKGDGVSEVTISSNGKSATLKALA